MKFLSEKLLTAAALVCTVAMPVSAGEAQTQPAKTDWLSVYSASENGGFIVGNPDAPTKLIEYASYTCGHCANFEAIEAPKIKSKNIATGAVSFEIRSLVRDIVDLTTAMLARCGGKDSFFANHEFLMAKQTDIDARKSKVTKPTIALLNANNLTGFMVAAYSEMNLGELMQQLGVGNVQAKACLADKAEMDKLIATSDAALPTYNINATPSFVINGKYAPDAYDFATLQPFLTAQTSSK